MVELLGEDVSCGSSWQPINTIHRRSIQNDSINRKQKSKEAFENDKTLKEFFVVEERKKLSTSDEKKAQLFFKKEVFREDEKELESSSSNFYKNNSPSGVSEILVHLPPQPQQQLCCASSSIPLIFASGNIKYKNKRTKPASTQSSSQRFTSYNNTTASDFDEVVYARRHTISDMTMAAYGMVICGIDNTNQRYRGRIEK